MLASKVHHLCHLLFGYLVWIDSAYTHTPLVNMEHDLHGVLFGFVEEPFQHKHDEFHRRVVVVQHQDFVHGWFFGPGLDGRSHPRAGAGTATWLIGVLVLAAHRREDGLGKDRCRHTYKPVSHVHEFD